MAMDNRQTKIVEGAGLEESRVNQDFVAFLSKWSSPALFTMALIAGGWWFWNVRQESKLQRIDTAHVQLERALLSGNPNPATLVALADQFSAVTGISPRALLAAADIRLSAASRGVVPGTSIGFDGAIEETDLLTEDEREQEYQRAADLYRRVWDATRNDSALAIHALGAASGLAAVAESLGEIEQAREFYQRVIDLAERERFSAHAVVARQRMNTIEDRIANRPRLFAQSELPSGWADRDAVPQDGGAMQDLPPDILQIDPLDAVVDVIAPEVSGSDQPPTDPQSEAPQANPQQADPQQTPPPPPPESR